MDVCSMALIILPELPWKIAADRAYGCNVNIPRDLHHYSNQGSANTHRGAESIEQVLSFSLCLDCLEVAALEARIMRGYHIAPALRTCVWRIRTACDVCGTYRSQRVAPNLYEGDSNGTKSTSIWGHVGYIAMSSSQPRGRHVWGAVYSLDTL